MQTHHLEQVRDGQNQWWKYLIVFGLSFLGGAFVAMPFLIAVSLAFDGLYDTAYLDTYFESGSLPANGPFGLPLGLLSGMLPFLGGFLIFWGLSRWLHKRSLANTINGTGSIRWRRVFYAASLMTVLLFIVLVINYAFRPSNFTFQFEGRTFAFLVLVSFLLIPIQTTLEELLFRGYLAHGIAAYIKSRFIVFLIPAVLFALVHSGNPEVSAFGFWIAMSLYFIYALFYGLLAILDDGIELSMGAHAANNVFLSVMLTFSASVFQTGALFVQHETFLHEEIPQAIAVMVIFFVIVSRKYNLKLNRLISKV